MDDYWGPSKKILGDMKFLENLINFDKDNIAPRIMDKLKHQILNDENFDPDKVKVASLAAEGMFLNVFSQWYSSYLLLFLCAFNFL